MDLGTGRHPTYQWVQGYAKLTPLRSVSCLDETDTKSSGGIEQAVLGTKTMGIRNVCIHIHIYIEYDSIFIKVHTYQQMYA